MTRTEVQKLEHGLYEIWWVSGGSSLASVGSKPNGQRWMAPTNWTGGGSHELKHWKAVERVELLRSSSTREWPPSPGTNQFDPEED